jgi:hypothetical protein
VAVTAYLVRAVNPRLFVAGQVLSATDLERLLKTWYRVNLVRLVAAGGAWLCAERVAFSHTR